jgi:translation initiation factor IF-3
VPVPRRFDRRLPERDLTRINDRIRVPEVRLVGEDGKQIGVVRTTEALAYAQERDLDLVEVAPEARPPVCRLLDYSKYKYEQAQKQKAARKHQQQITIREIKFRPKIAQNDYDTKKGHVSRFLLGKDKVKITIMFRGREVTHPERGTALLDRLAGELAEIAVIEQSPVQDGRNMTMMLAPSKAVLAGEYQRAHAAGAEAADADVSAAELDEDVDADGSAEGERSDLRSDDSAPVSAQVGTGEPEAAEPDPPGEPEAAEPDPPGEPEAAEPDPPGEAEAAERDPPGEPEAAERDPTLESEADAPRSRNGGSRSRARR